MTHKPSTYLVDIIPKKKKTKNKQPKAKHDANHNDMSNEFYEYAY